MPRASTAFSRNRPSGGERVVNDDQGQLWSAIHVDEGDESLVMFTCISDARRSGRIASMAAGVDIVFGDVPDEQLLDWLRHAPPVGRLS